VNRILKLFHSTIHHSFKRCDQCLRHRFKGRRDEREKGQMSEWLYEKGNSREMKKFS